MEHRAEVEIERPGRTMLLDVTAEVDAHVPGGDYITRAATIDDVSIERVTCASCGQAVELTADERRIVERQVEREADAKLENERRAAAEDAA